MTDNSWSNPWKLIAIGMGLVIVTAAVTGLVVANRLGTESDRASTESKTARARIASETPAARPPTPPRASTEGVAPSRPAAPRAPASTVPTQATVDACHQSAASQVGSHDKTIEVLKDAAIGAAAGAAVGAAGGAIAGGGKGAGTGAAVGGVVGAGGGSLYGLNENQKKDQRYRDAYASCMHARGYSG